MIYATGDLHGNSLRFQPQYFPEQAEMTKDDYMIVCGDFGCIWNGDKSDDPQLDRLEALPFTVLFVDGNHENFDALNEYPVEQWHGGNAHKIRPHVIHLMRGQAFELQGRTFLFDAIFHTLKKLSGQRHTAPFLWYTETAGRRDMPWSILNRIKSSTFRTP